MTFTEAAAEVLRLAGKPMHYKEITELAIEKNLLSHVGKSPEVTMGARLAALLKKDDKANPIVRVKPGVFALRDWDQKKGKKGKGAVAPEVEVDDSAESAESDVNALEVEAVAQKAAQPAVEIEEAVAEDGADEAAEDEDDKQPISGEDALRADLAASGAELFDDEDDDDQPILAPAGAANGADLTGEGGRRRRRRRRRGRGGAQTEFAIPGERASAPRLEAGAPQATAAAAAEVENGVEARDPLAPAPRPLVRDRQQLGLPTGVELPLGEGDELSGRDLADAAAAVLATFDKNQGAVPIRAVVDALIRRGRLSGDPMAAATQLSASLRADVLRRRDAGLRPRFRFSNGSRVGLTDWVLGQDLGRLEQDVIQAVERYREASRRAFLRRLQELPGHAFVELALLALERVGVTNLKAVRRAGSPGGEVHFQGVHRTGADEIRVAVVIRKDGREIGRERVTDLRGALHHYGPATAGWLLTTGQVLSGARDEAAAPGAAPIALFDGLAFCKLLEENDVAVVRARFPVAIPDLELLESLRG